MSLKTLTSRIRKKSLLSLPVLEFGSLVIHAMKFLTLLLII